MDALEVLRLHGEPGDIGIGRELAGHLPHHVFHKHGVVIGLFSNVFFIGPLEDGVDVTA